MVSVPIGSQIRPRAPRIELGLSDASILLLVMVLIFCIFNFVIYIVSSIQSKTLLVALLLYCVLNLYLLVMTIVIVANRKKAPSTLRLLGVPGLIDQVIVLSIILLFIDMIIIGFGLNNTGIARPQTDPQFLLLSQTVLAILMLSGVGILYIILVLLFFLDKSANYNNQVTAWNWAKGAGGTIFADVTNTVGVVAGIGGLSILTNSLGWWWLGQFAAAMAVLIATSQYQNWLRDIDASFETNFVSRLNSVLNVSIGIGIVLSLMHQSNNAVTMAYLKPGRITWLIVITICLILIPIIESIVERVLRNKKSFWGPLFFLSFPLVGLVILSL